MAESNNSNRNSGTSARSNYLFAVLGAAATAAATFWVSASNTPDAVPQLPADKLPKTKNVESIAQAPRSLRAVQRAVFYDEKVQPQIERADALNREAAARCVARIDEKLNQYRRGINPFVQDLTSMSTRFGIISRMPANWWRQDQRVERYVRTKFEKHLFSRQQLTADIAGILDDFKTEISANQKRMLISVKTAIGSADLPEVQADEYEPFFEAVANQLQRYSAAQGANSVENAIGAFVLGEVGFFAGRSLVASLLARFGATAVAGTVGSAGATAGSTAAGTGTGAFGGPVGAVVGFGVGLVVGVVIDMWMTEKFQEQLSRQLNQYLDALGDTMMHGGARRSRKAADPIQQAQEQVGLVEALPVLCDRLKSAYRECFYEQIVTGTSE